MNNNYYNQNPYGNPYYQQPMYQQPMQQQMSSVIPMAYVNGLEGAKSYWMGTNQIAYLRDNNDDSIMYEKKTDNLGKYYIKGYKLTELQLDQNGGFKTQNSQDSINLLNSKLDAIYAILAPKNEVNNNEQSNVSKQQ